MINIKNTNGTNLRECSNVYDVFDSSKSKLLFNEALLEFIKEKYCDDESIKEYSSSVDNRILVRSSFDTNRSFQVLL